MNLYANAPTDDMGTDITASIMASGNDHAMDLLRILAKIRMKSVCTVTEFFSYVDSAVSGTDLAIVTPYLDTAICNYARDKMYNNVHVQIYLTNFVEQKEIPDDLEIYIIKKEFVQKTQESPEDGDAA